MTRKDLDLVLLLLLVASAKTCIAAHYRDRERPFFSIGSGASIVDWAVR